MSNPWRIGVVDCKINVSTMRKKILTIIVAVLCGLLSVPGAPTTGRVGLVLSGGGSKGIAHIGFIKAMEEAGIPIDCIAGTSMGAIVGALYSCGYSPDEMLEILQSREFMNWATGVTPPADDFYFNRPKDTPEWLGVNLATSDSATISNLFPTRLVNPLPMSFAFMAMFSEATAAANNDFDKLFVPYRAVASDIYRHRKIVFDHGQLPLAVRASMSFPLVYQPIMVDSTLMYDGGLYDVYPVDVMMSEFNPDHVIGVDVSTPNTPPGLNDLIGQIENMVMTGYMAPFPNEKGINVVFDLSRFGLTNWQDAAEIYTIGYKRGVELADSMKQLVGHLRPKSEVNSRRQKFRSGLRPIKFKSVKVSDTDMGKRHYIVRTFTAGAEMPMSLEEARQGFYRVTSTGRMRNLVPHAAYDSVSGMFDLDLHADVTKDFKLGVGGYLTSGSQSMIYAGMRYNPLDFKHPYADIEGWAGQDYLAAAAKIGRLIDTSSPSRAWIGATVARERFAEHEKMFYDFKSPAWNIASQLTVDATYEIAMGRHGAITASLGYGHLTSGFRPPLPDGESLGRQRVIRDLGRLRITWRRTTLDDLHLPTSGWEIEAEATALYGAERTRMHDLRTISHPAWAVGFIHLTDYIPLTHKFTVGAEVTVLYSTQKLAEDYNTAIALAPSFTPFTSMESVFNPAYRANQFVAIGITPVWKISELFQLRFSGQMFAPMRRILPAGDSHARYGAWFGSAEFTGELSFALKLPFGAVRAYGHYSTARYEHWGGGISLGVLLRAPKFLR